MSIQIKRFMLSVPVPSVILLNVVAPKYGWKINFGHQLKPKLQF